MHQSSKRTLGRRPSASFNHFIIMRKNSFHFAYDDNPLSGGGSMFFTSWDDLVNHWLPEFNSRKECEDYLSKTARGVILESHDEPIIHAKKLGHLSNQEEQELLAYTEFKCDFYDKVEERLNKFYQHLDYFQICAPEFGDMEVIFGYTELSGKNVIDHLFIPETTNVDKAIEELNMRLVEDYPGFVRFESLEQAIEMALKEDDEDNNYNVTISDSEDTRSLDVSICVSHKSLGFAVEEQVVHVSCDEAEYWDDFHMNRSTVKDVVSSVKLDLFGEFSE